MNSQSIITRLAKSFPDINFQRSDVAYWSPSEKTVFYDDSAENLVHELSHAILGHDDFLQDIELIHIERDAWEKAREIGMKYEVKITDEIIETALDNYREWLHKRSLCPKCSQTSLQSRKDLVYYCINCDARWQANDARSCGLKRRVTDKPKTAL